MSILHTCTSLQLLTETMLRNKVALVTGSTSGIGLGIAKSLAKQGAHIILNGFGDPTAISNLVTSFKDEYQVNATFEGADLSKVPEIEAMMENAIKQHGKVDIVVNNAGIQHISPVESFPVDAWNNVIAINLSAVFHTTRLAIPHMKANNWGRIINIAS